jgi:hypothetical protein
MASVKKGILSRPPEWWKHLRWAKRKFWGKERKAAQRDAVKQVREEKSAS